MLLFSVNRICLTSQAVAIKFNCVFYYCTISCFWHWWIVISLTYLMNVRGGVFFHREWKSSFMTFFSTSLKLQVWNLHLPKYFSSYSLIVVFWINFQYPALMSFFFYKNLFLRFDFLKCSYTRFFSYCWKFEMNVWWSRVYQVDFFSHIARESEDW